MWPFSHGWKELKSLGGRKFIAKVPDLNVPSERPLLTLSLIVRGHVCALSRSRRLNAQAKCEQMALLHRALPYSSDSDMHLLICDPLSEPMSRPNQPNPGRLRRLFSIITLLTAANASSRGATVSKSDWSNCVKVALLQSFFVLKVEKDPAKRIDSQVDLQDGSSQGAAIKIKKKQRQRKHKVRSCVFAKGVAACQGQGRNFQSFVPQVELFILQP